MPEHLTIAVLGDLGRSPRMLNHAWAAAESGFDVRLVGYDETPLDLALAAKPGVRVVPVRPAGRAAEGSRRLYVLAYSVFKGLLLTARLGRALLGGGKPQAVLVQNPPSLPTLAVGWAAARLRGARLWVDWHNFGYAMLALRLGSDSGFVALMRRLELFFGRRADAAFCVSQAMQEALEREGVSAEILPDLPRTTDPPLSRAERVSVQQRLFPGDRGLLVHCPTSWTADEDIELLLEAARLRETDGAGPPVEVIVTGKGPTRPEYESRIADMDLRRTKIRTAFLSPEDYRLLLRAADVGLSLHRSASAVDLPMKIVDFYAAGTPVLALRYAPTLDEQVTDGATGRTFETADELAGLLGETSFDALRPAVRDAWSRTWTPAWQSAARSLGVLR